MSKTRYFLAQVGNKTGYPLSQFLFNIVPEDLASVIRQGKEIQYIQSGKEEVKTFLFVDGMVGYGENSKEMGKTNKTPRTNK